ncbi:MAG: outer membrane beta-barrel protein [Phaeodactylibacter sp.]|nr:outer membrane beta-barrel protein [Phaeodactylibacter sp.]MCB9301409.1 outer membrane beta-barrel protein [Lewinellaceae bacterium]
MNILKSTLFLAILMMSISQATNAQSCNRCPRQGFADLNLGIGLLSTYFKDGGAPATGLPLSFSLDYRLQRHFSLGAYAGYSYSHGTRPLFNSETAVPWQNRTTVAGLRFAAHSNPIGNWEAYGGTAAGLYSSRFEIMDAGEKTKAKEHGYQENNNRFYMTGFLGARYQLSRKLRLFAEIGMGDSLLKLGASARL